MYARCLSSALIVVLMWLSSIF